MRPKIGAACLAVALWSAPALACDPDETFLFACETTNPARAIFLCGREEDTGEGMRMTGVRYLYRTERGDELSYPADPAEGLKKLYFSHLFRNDLYEAYVRFVIGKTTYRLFFRDAPQSSDPDTVNGPDGGVEVLEDGKLIATVQCGERPLWYFDETRRAIACDMENPFGAQGCSPEVLVVK